MRFLLLAPLFAAALAAATPDRPSPPAVPCKVIAPDPRYVEVRELRGKGDFAGALECMLKIEEDDGMSLGTRGLIARVQMEMKEHAAARNTWDVWIEKHPTEWQARRGRGQILTELALWKESAADLAASIESLTKIEDPLRLESLRLSLRLWFARAMSEGEDKASEELRKRLPRVEPEQDDSFSVPLARFFVQDLSEKELLDLAGQTHEGWQAWRRGQAGWAIGLRRLVRGDRDGAREWFRVGLGEEEYRDNSQHEVSEMLRLLDSLKENSK